MSATGRGVIRGGWQLWLGALIALTSVLLVIGIGSASATNAVMAGGFATSWSNYEVAVTTYDGPPRLSQRQPGNIRLRLCLIEHHDHDWLLLASDHPRDWSKSREGASGVEDCAPELAKSKPNDHLDQKCPKTSKPASSRG